MPIPQRFTQARLILDGQAYDLVSATVTNQETSYEREAVYGAGRVRGFTAGRTTERVSIEAELIPVDSSIQLEPHMATIMANVEPIGVFVADARELESDDALRARILGAMNVPSLPYMATGEALDRLAETYGFLRQQIVRGHASTPVESDASKKDIRTDTTQAGLSPKSVWDRLLEAELLC